MTPNSIISAALAAWRDCAEYVVVDAEDDPRALAGQVREEWQARSPAHSCSLAPILGTGNLVVLMSVSHQHQGTAIIIGKNKG